MTTIDSTAIRQLIKTFKQASNYKNGRAEDLQIMTSLGPISLWTSRKHNQRNNEILKHKSNTALSYRFYKSSITQVNNNSPNSNKLISKRICNQKNIKGHPTKYLCPIEIFQ